MKLRVLLADDHHLMRSGLRQTLEKHLDMEVVGEADNGMEIIRLAREHSPDFIIMDISMPGMSGVEATKQIVDEMPKIKIIGFSMHTEEQKIIDLLQAGAKAYVLKDSPLTEFLRAIEMVRQGKAYISPSIGGNIIQSYLEHLPSTHSSLFNLLTIKEREVLKLIAEGKTSKDIADFLCLGIKTIESHRQHLMDKLNLHTVAELTKFAIREGVTEL